MKNYRLLLTILGLFPFTLLKAQSDTIVKKTSEKIPCFIQIVDDEKELITYKVMKGENVPVLSIKYERVDRLIFRNGQVIRYDLQKEVSEAEESFIGKKKNTVRVGIFTPTYGILDLSYERNINPFLNLEGTVGIISDHFEIIEGDNGRAHQHGASLSLRAKFFFNGLGEKGSSRKHPLSGMYVAPEVTLAMYKYARRYYYYDPYWIAPYGIQERWVNNTSGALLVNFGYEYAFADIFTLDLFGGLGIGIDDLDRVDYGVRRYSHFKGDVLAYNIGLRLGMAF